MITIKTPEQITKMKEAGRILSELRKELEQHLKPGVSTLKLDEIANNFLAKQGVVSSFLNYEGYKHSICASVNDCVVHGIPSKDVVLKDGDIISLDLGVYKDGFHADSAWTYEIGEVKPEVQELVKRTYESLEEAMKVVKPGNFITEIGKAIENCLKPFKYGIVREFCGHGIGEKLHEDPYIFHFNQHVKHTEIKEGMTICIEPMVNLGSHKVKVLKDGWTTVTKDHKPAAHFEYTLLVTKEGCEVLTPKI